ncbi:dTMP kinase [Streptomyces sp. SYSU K217416]
MKGLFVTIDGASGLGKSTLADALTRHLRSDGHRVHATAEPSTRPVGVFTRNIADQVHGHALACLVAADRFDHLIHEIRPQLEAGATVVCDRYLASSLVLQRLDGVPTDYILSLNTGIELPDLAVILTASPSIIAQRIADRGAHHRFERDPEIPAREVALYAEATLTLKGLGIPVLTVDVGRLTPSEGSDRIASELSRLRGTVTHRTNME